MVLEFRSAEILRKKKKIEKLQLVLAREQEKKEKETKLVCLASFFFSQKYYLYSYVCVMT